MSQQITPLSPAIPATTAIQDPAARRFAAAVTDTSLCIEPWHKMFNMHTEQRILLTLSY